MNMRVLRYWNKYVTLGGILIFLAICGVILLTVQMLPVTNQVGESDSLIIIPVQTYTPTVTKDPENNRSTMTPTTESIAGFQVGKYVKVIGTGGAGLRIRAEPGLSASVSFVALDDELFLVKDGPVRLDDYIWWFIAAPYDVARSGWAASDFLLPIE